MYTASITFTQHNPRHSLVPARARYDPHPARLLLDREGDGQEEEDSGLRACARDIGIQGPIRARAG